VSQRDLYVLPKYVEASYVDVFLAMQYYTSPFIQCKQIRLLHDIYPFLETASLASRDDWVSRYGVNDIKTLAKLTESYVSDFALRNDREQIRAMYSVLYSLAVDNAAAVLTVSNYSAQGLLTLFPKASGKIHVVHPFVDPRLLTKKFNRVKDDTTFRILNIGNWEPRKNHFELLKAVQSLWSDGFNVKLISVGRPTGSHRKYADYLARLMRQGSHQGWLEIHQAVSECKLAKLYISADLMVQPSLFEGFGLPVLEALAFGLPLLATHIPAFVEVAAEAATWCGFDRMSIAESIASLMKDNDRLISLSSASSRRAPYFSRESSIAHLVKILAH